MFLSGYLVLEDGAVFPGRLFGHIPRSPAFGEAVFNTAMVGYEEVLTDPSYLGQIVVMTSCHQGNYGISLQDRESAEAHLSGFVVHELCEVPSNWRARMSLSDYLSRQKVPGLCGVDTRSLTLHLRRCGAMRGAIVRTSVRAHERMSVEKIVHQIKKQPAMEGLGLAQKVSISQVSLWQSSPQGSSLVPLSHAHTFARPHGPVIAVWDFGIKWSILRRLEALGFKSVLFPSDAKAEDLLRIKPAGIVLSNGPGDPAALPGIISEIQRLLQKKNRTPVLGICLGHQLLALACGAKTYKMKFGHHGVNHPVQDLRNKRVWISSHNHGFAVDAQTLARGWQPLYISLNDGALEGMRSQALRVLSVQFHPESAPGPWEAAGVFDEFARMVKG